MVAGSIERTSGRVDGLPTIFLLPLLPCFHLFAVGISQGIMVSGYSKQKIEMIAFSLPFFIKGLKTLKFKSDRRNSGPLYHPSPEGDTDVPLPQGWER
jgi:hypothetical protein